MSHVWTQSMSLHLNGGSKFSQLNFNIFCDGKETGIVRVTRTNGTPKYLKTVDKLILGDEEFDVLASRGAGMKEWLEAHAPKEEHDATQTP